MDALKKLSNIQDSMRLSNLSSRVDAHGLYFKGKVIIADGYRFIECRFDKCSLQINTDNFEFIDCVFDDQCTIQYSSSITKVIRIFLGRYSWARDFIDPYFLPKINPDGGETISDQED